MLHIVKQYRKMIFLFLENNLDNPLNEGQINAISSTTESKNTDNVIKDALADKRLTTAERVKITNLYNEYLNGQATIKDETRKELESYLKSAKGGSDFELFKKNMLEKLNKVVSHNNSGELKLSENTNKNIVINFDIGTDSKDSIKVIALQTALVDLGYKLEGINNGIDGKFGRSTRLALELERDKISKNNLQTSDVLKPTPVASVVINGNQKTIDLKGKKGETTVMTPDNVPTAQSTAPEQSPEISNADLLTKLSDLDGNGKTIERNLVNEDDLKTALSKLSNGGEKGKLLNIYKNVTGKEVTTFTDNEVKEFKEKLLLNLQFLQGIGLNAGLYPLLNGKVEGFIKSISNEQRKIEIDDKIYENLTPTVKNVIAGLVTAGVLIISGGMVVVGYEETEFKTNNFIKRIEDSNDNSVLSGLKSVLTYIKDALMGRRLSVSFGKDKMDVDEVEKEITEFTTELLSLKLDGTDTDIKNPKLKAMYTESMELSKKYDIDSSTPDGKKILQKILIQSYILNLGEEQKGSDWKATIGLLFIGLHRDNIDTTYVATKLSSSNKEEARLMEKSLTSDELKKVGLSIEKNGDKYKHNIPEKGTLIKLEGDDREFPIKEVVLPEGVDILNSDKIYDFKLSHILGEEDYYILTLVERIGGSTNINPQGISEVKVVRQFDSKLNGIRLNEKLKEGSKLGDSLYMLGHDVKFSKLVKAISRGDKNAVETELDTLGKGKYKSLAKTLKANIASFTEWDSYMSGSKNTRKLKSPKYESVRLDGVLNAEKTLAIKSGFPKPSPESNFKVTGKYISKQILEVLPGQEITSVQFMTPKDINNINKSKEALHRVSVVDGSFAITEKYIEVTDNGRKQSIIEGLLNSAHESLAIKNQFKKLNTFLGTRGEVSLDQYKAYLISGNIDDLGVTGLKLQEGKGTKFIESRAMVAGNICLNATYVIAYPAFEGQIIASVGIQDATAKFNLGVVTGDEISAGLNPIAIAANLSKGGKPSGGDGPVSTTTDGTGGQIPGGAPNNVASPVGQAGSGGAAANGGGFTLPN